MKKKIIFVTKALWIGGIETALVNLLNNFDYEQYEVTLMVCRAELNMLDQIDSRCRVLIADRRPLNSFQQNYKYNKLYHLTEEADNPSKLHRAMLWSIPIIKWIENRLYIRYIRNAMRNERFDTAVIYNDVVAELTVQSIHADKFLMFYHHGATRHVYHDMAGYKKCDKIIAVSLNLAEKLKKFVPKYADKITAVHNLTNVKAIREKGEFECDDIFDPLKFNIVTVGRISDEKGMDMAVSACRRLIECGYQNIVWWIVGGGPVFHKIEEMVSELHLEKYLKLTGMKSNPYPYIKNADLYVQPSRVEAFPMTIKEAMVLGKSIISTDTDGAREILSENFGNCLCAVHADALAEAVKNYIENNSSGSAEEINDRYFIQENEEALKALYSLL